jgi:hypothetical protein
MKILITTPNGTIGRRIVPDLLAPEFSVRVITRNPDRLSGEIRDQVEIIRGSTDDILALREGLEGVDALFWCVPPAPNEDTNVQSHYERFACAASRAIREAETPRVVSISATPISALHAAEEILNDSRAAIRHIRCDWFTIVSDTPDHTSLVPHIADIALRLLVRTDWRGIEAITIPALEELAFVPAPALIENIRKSPDIGLSVARVSVDVVVAAIVAQHDTKKTLKQKL